MDTNKRKYRILPLILSIIFGLSTIGGISNISNGYITDNTYIATILSVILCIVSLYFIRKSNING